MNGRFCRDLTCVLGLVACCSLLAGCRRGSVASNGAHAKPSSALPSSAKRSMTPEEEAQFLGKDPEEMPLLLGPGAAFMSASEREQRLRELLSGQIPSERLPLVDTDPDAPHDPDLHARLTSTALGRSVGKVEVNVGLPKRLSGTIDEAQASRTTLPMRGTFESCFLRWVWRDGDAPPDQQFDVELLVKDDGSVGSVTFEGKQAATPAEFFACAQEGARGSQFEPPPSKPSRLRFSVDVSAVVPGGLAGLK